jgi:hypothetical protein
MSTFCIMDKRCVVYDKDLGTPGISYAHPACQGCSDDLRTLLNQLRYDAIDLGQLVPKPVTGGKGERIFRPAPESTPPINVLAYDLRAAIGYTVGLAAVVLRHAEGLPQPPIRKPLGYGYALDRDVKLLGVHVDELMRLPATQHYWDPAETVLSELDGVGVVLLLRRLHRVARRVCGLDPRTITVPGDCPHCEATATLRRTDFEPQVIWCVRCKRRLDLEGYRKLMMMAGRERHLSENESLPTQ